VTGSDTRSAVTGKVLSVRTLAAYGSDWALFTDWCTATGVAPLPADWTTINASPPPARPHPPPADVA